MAYAYHTHLSSSLVGVKRTPQFIAIHWYGTPGQTGDVHGTARYLAGATHASVHYVTSAGVVYCLVSPDNAAFGQGDGASGYGNTYGISIENNPWCTPADRETTAELIADLRTAYGNLPLRPHKDFTATACPGVWEQHIGWLSARANQIIAERKGHSAPAPVAPALPSNPAPSNNLRKVTAGVGYVRVAPNAGSALVSKYPAGLANGAVIAVEGYVRGQDPYPNDGIDNNHWFKTASGYIWASGAGGDIRGLKDLTVNTPPPAPAPKPAPTARTFNRVISRDDGAVIRTGPGTNYPVAAAYPHGIAKGVTISVLGYVAGQDPYGDGNNAWFKTISGYYVWANNAGNSLAGLPML